MLSNYNAERIKQCFCLAHFGIPSVNSLLWKDHVFKWENLLLTFSCNYGKSPFLMGKLTVNDNFP